MQPGTKVRVGSESQVWEVVSTTGKYTEIKTTKEVKVIDKGKLTEQAHRMVKTEKLGGGR